MNKKIINATVTEYDAIIFKSRLERDAYKTFLQAGLEVQYEVAPIILLKGFRPKTTIKIRGKERVTKKGTPVTIRDWTYTPDFVLKHGDKTIYVEMKGFGNDNLPLKRKMFLHYLEQFDNVEYWEVYSIKELKTLIDEEFK